MNLTFEKLEFFFAILVRISAFIMAAPFFNQRSVPVRVKAALSFFIAVIVFNLTDYKPIGDNFSIQYAVILIQEALIGASLGFTANLCLYVNFKLFKFALLIVILYFPFPSSEVYFEPFFGNPKAAISSFFVALQNVHV